MNTIDDRKRMVEFINEATSVYNETGLTPRQLLKQRDDLLAALKEMMARYPSGGSGTAEDRKRACDMSRKAIKLSEP